MSHDPRRRAPQSISQVLSEGQTSFGRILKRARALERLNLRVLDLLGPELAGRCQVANVRAGRLIFACASPACATRLRMQSERLLEQLHAVGLTDIEAIEVKLVPPG